MNKRGVSLIELLGAIIIFSIAISLAALILKFFIKANNRITIDSQANYEGNLVIRRIEEKVRELEPTTFSTCPGVCFTLSKEFSYELNPSTEVVELVIYSTSLDYSIEIDNQVLYLDSEPYVFDNFTLGAESYVDISQVGSYDYLDLKIVLESNEGYLYEFLLNYSFEDLVIPSG